MMIFALVVGLSLSQAPGSKPANPASPKSETERPEQRLEKAKARAWNMSLPPPEPPLLTAGHHMTMTACLVGVNTARSALGLRLEMPGAALGLCKRSLWVAFDLLGDMGWPTRAGCGLAVAGVFGVAGRQDEIGPMSDRAEAAIHACERDVLKLTRPDPTK